MIKFYPYIAGDFQEGEEALHDAPTFQVAYRAFGDVKLSGLGRKGVKIPYP